MCGIAGLLTKGEAVMPQVVQKEVSNVIYHRGPDNFSFYQDAHVVFFHRRLKIIDLSDEANQPMVSEDGKLVLTFNGEIYNYREIRGRLSGNGVKFRTSSDTEVLLQHLLLTGNSDFSRLRGIFAFSIWNAESRELILVRDQYGVKPLYYYCDGERFIYGSEIKVLFALGCEAKLSEARIGELLNFGQVAGEETIYYNVKRLLPGHYLRITLDEFKVSTKKYFDHFSNTFEPRRSLSLQDWGTVVREGLETSIRSQMISDVPVGFMCSGGIDSSAISVIASRFSHSRINTYCAKVAYDGFDETAFARLVASQISSFHQEVDSTANDVTHLLDTLVWLHDEPLRHPNSVPIFQINRLAKQDVTVLLTGEGADEIFGGYKIYQFLHRIQRFRKYAPRASFVLLKELFKSLGRSARTLTLLSERSVEDMLVARNYSFDPSLMQELAPELKVNTDWRYQFAEDSTKFGSDFIQAMLFFDQQVHLQSLLDRQDRMCMGNAIEGRVPFLDVDFVKIANSIPPEFKASSSITKIALREAMREIVPPEIVDRPKHAFSLPVLGWISQSKTFQARIGELVNSDIVKMGMVDKSSLNIALKQAFRGNAKYGDFIWNLLNLDAAYQLFVKKSIKPNLQQLCFGGIES